MFKYLLISLCLLGCATTSNVPKSQETSNISKNQEVQKYQEYDRCENKCLSEYKHCLKHEGLALVSVDEETLADIICYQSTNYCSEHCS